MRIHEVIMEQEQLDEITASGLGTGIGNFAGTQVRRASDFFTGMKKGYQKARYLSPSKQPASSTSQTTTTPAAASQGATAVPQTTTQQAATSGAAPQQTQTTAPAASGSTAPPMKSAEIVKGLDDVWKKATADQGSETTSFQVQNQIRAMAKQAGLTGQTIKENKIGYYSKFLDMEI